MRTKLAFRPLQRRDEALQAERDQHRRPPTADHGVHALPATRAQAPPISASASRTNSEMDPGDQYGTRALIYS